MCALPEPTPVVDSHEHTTKSTKLIGRGLRTDTGVEVLVSEDQYNTITNIFTVETIISDPDMITAAPTSQESCSPECSLNAKYVSVMLWPQEKSNTDCLATITTEPQPDFHPENFTPVFPSVYAFIASMTVTDGCNPTTPWSNIFTASFDPSEMTTVDAYGDPKRFNFEELPCPPPDTVDLHGRPYQPYFWIPSSLIDQLRKVGEVPDGDCHRGIWLDPPIALLSRPGVNGPEDGGRFGKHGKRWDARAKRTAVAAPHTQWVPAKTTPAV